MVNMIYFSNWNLDEKLGKTSKISLLIIFLIEMSISKVETAFLPVPAAVA